MTSTKGALALHLCSLVQWQLAGAQQVPIPHVPGGDGFDLAEASVRPHFPAPRLDAFYDLVCPDSKASWPTIKALSTHYGTKLEIRVQPFPLPYHHNAFYLWQGAIFVAEVREPAAA